jgi:hypothetical protein
MSFYGYGCVVQYQLRGAIPAAWGNIICLGQYCGCVGQRCQIWPSFCLLSFGLAILLLAGYEDLAAPLFALSRQCKAEVTVPAPGSSP